VERHDEGDAGRTEELALSREGVGLKKGEKGGSAKKKKKGAASKGSTGKGASFSWEGLVDDIY